MIFERRLKEASRIPQASFAIIYTERQLGLIDKPEDILLWKILLAFVLLGLLALIPVFFKKLLKKKN